MTTKIENKLEIIKWIICFALALACLLIPEQGIVTIKFKLFLAIPVWALALAAFELLPEMAIAIMMLGLWFFFGVADASVIMGSWVGTTMLMVAGTFFLGAALDDCGLLRRISYWIMCKVKGSYFKLLFSVMLCGIVLNILTSGQANIIYFGVKILHNYKYHLAGEKIFMQAAEVGKTL